MTRERVSTVILSIVNGMKNIEIDDLDENLFGIKYDYSARDMASIFIEVEKLFNVDLNILVKLFEYASVNSLIDSVCELIGAA